MKGMKAIQRFSIFPPLGKLSKNVGSRFSTNSVKGIRNPTFQRPSKLKPEEIDPITLKAMKQKVKYDPIPLNLYPNVYTVQDVGPEYDVSGFDLDRQKIFNGMYTCYIPPGSFEYQLPNKGKAEIAFIGRSNVGKSSLVDSLLGGKKIVRISKEAGCTTQINYFAFVNALSKDYNPKPNTIIHEDQHLAYLVDMPGYGFAKRSQQLMKQWNTALRKYLLARDQSTLRRVYILIDSRHGVKQSDAHMMDTLNETSIPYQLIFTKSDLTSKDQLHKGLKSAFEIMLTMKNNCCLPYIHVVSSKVGTGLDNLQLFMVDVMQQPWTKPPSM